MLAKPIHCWPNRYIVRGTNPVGCAALINSHSSLVIVQNVGVLPRQAGAADAPAASQPPILAIVAGVAGAVGFLAAAAVVFFYVWPQRSKQAQQAKDEEENMVLSPFLEDSVRLLRLAVGLGNSMYHLEVTIGTAMYSCCGEGPRVSTACMLEQYNKCCCNRALELLLLPKCLSVFGRY